MAAPSPSDQHQHQQHHLQPPQQQPRRSRTPTSPRKGGGGGSRAHQQQQQQRPPSVALSDNDARSSEERGPIGAGLALPAGAAYAEVDGSVLEGGGQIIRNAFALSALLRRPVRISRVRANRARPGLQAQHLAGVRLVASLHGNAVEGDALHSHALAFVPGPFALQTPPRAARVDVGTAGSVGLIVQIALPTLLFGAPPGAQLSLDAKGGTHVAFAPTTDYLARVFLPAAASLLGVAAGTELTTTRNGFYPRGGGEASLRVTAVSRLRPFTLLERGDVTEISICTRVSRIARNVAEREAQSALQTIKAKLRPLPARVDVEPLDVSSASSGEGTWCQITARTSTGCVFCATAIGERGKRAEDVGAEAAKHLLKDLLEGGCVDEYLQDQLLIFMALADGESAMRVGEVSLHTQTSIHVAHLLTNATFTVTPDPPPRTTSVIRCVGIGYKNPFIGDDVPPNTAPAAPNP